MGFDAGSIEATLDLDRDPFQRKLVDAKRQARDFANGKYATTLDADTRTADAKIIDLRSRLDRLSADRVTPKIDLDGFTEAEARVKLLQEQLDRLNRTRVSPRIGGGGSGGGLAGGGSGGGGFFRPHGLLAAALLGAPAAVPLGVGALGLGASFLTPTLAGAAGLGLFGAASKASVTRVAKVEDQLQKLNQRIAATPATRPAGTAAQVAAAQARVTAAEANLSRAQYVGGTARVASAQASLSSAQASLQRAQGGGTNPAHDKLVAQRAALLKQLTPAEKGAAEGIERLEKGWLHFQRALEPQTFKLVATGTDIAVKGLHLMLPATKAVGGELDHLAKRADKALGDPFWQQFFGTFLTQEAPRAVDTLGRVVGSVASGFAHLSEDFAPLGHRLEDDVVRWSGIFDKWTQGSGPERFVALVERDGPIAAQALKGLASGLGGLAAGLEPIGRVELQALTPVLTFVGDLGKQHPAVITALGAAYLSVAGGLKAISAVRGLAGITGLLKGGGGFSGGGGKGGGGVLGALEGRGSPTNPMYVVVLDKGIPGVPGTPGAKGPIPKALDYGRKVLPFVKGAGPVALAAGAAYTISQMHDPKHGAADIAAAEHDPAIMHRYQELLAQYQKTHPASSLDIRSAQITDQLIKQAMTDVKGSSTTYVLNNPTFNDVPNVREFERQLQREAQQARRRRALSGMPSNTRYQD